MTYLRPGRDEDELDDDGDHAHVGHEQVEG